MPANPPPRDPDDLPPEERELSRRSGTGAINPWLVVCLIALLAVVVYVASAVMA